MPLPDEAEELRVEAVAELQLGREYRLLARRVRHELRGVVENLDSG